MAHYDIMLYLGEENTPEAFKVVEDLCILVRHIQRGQEGYLDEVVVFYDPDIGQYLESNIVSFKAGETPTQFGVFKLHRHDTQFVFRNGKRYSIRLGTWDNVKGDKPKVMFHFMIDTYPFELPADADNLPNPPEE